ncbi:TPA: hypothetical protein DEP94_02635 [Candidatus Nomurabacteria bacterium]|nr:hypothetical protein [Candidatus Nomurabacteria bacterium]
MGKYIKLICLSLILGVTVFIVSTTLYYKNFPKIYTNNFPFLLKEKVEKPVTILAFGDMMLDRNVRLKIKANNTSYPFENIESFLSGHDIVVANLEGVFTNFPSVTAGVIDGPLQFTFDPKIIATLKQFNFTLFSVANNHSLNFGRNELDKSNKLLEKEGMSWFGDPSNKNLNSFTTTVRGEKITFIGYHEFAYQGFDLILNEIKLAKDNKSFVIVYPHWGEEYNKSMTKSQINMAHKFIDAGADVILGSHPHVIEPIEIYNGKAIFYSLGNFIFDQYSSGPTTEGLSVGVSITKDEVKYNIYPIDIKKAQASLMSKINSDLVLNNLSNKSVTDGKIKDGIKSGIFSLKK